ncbi:MAG: YgaP family membrane protein [Natrialbaceae archaeon]
MGIDRNVGGYDRLARAVLATVLAVVALSTLRKGRRSVGILATVGAVGFGINAVTCFCGLNRALGIDTTSGE